MTDSREYACPKCGVFVVKVSSPSGWARVFCRVCKTWRTIHMEKREELLIKRPR